MLREAGAAEVHFRVSSPPYQWPCFYGMDTGRRSELLAADLSVGEIRDFLGVDSLAYLELDRLTHATGAVVRRRSAPRASRATTRCRCRSTDSKHVLEDDSDAEPTSPTRTTPGEPADDRTSAPTAHLRRRRRRHRRGREGRRADQGARALARSGPRSSATSAASAGCSRFDAAALERPAARVVDRRRRHEVAASRGSPAATTPSASICVAMSVDDIAVQGAEPLFFLDYISIGKLVPEIDRRHRRRRRATAVAQAGLRAARRRDVGAPRPHGAGRVRPRRLRGRRGRAHRDPARGRAAGRRDRRYRQPRAALQRLLARAPRAARPRRASARRARVERRAPLARRRAAPPERDLRAGDARSCASRSTVHAFAHITGGGIPGNLARVLPGALRRGACDRGEWEEPRIFAEIQAAGDVPDDEMEHVFNLGLGMLAVVDPEDRVRYPGHGACGRSRGVDRRRGRRRPRSGKYHPQLIR